MEDNQTLNSFSQDFKQYHTHNGSDGTPYLDEELSIINTRKFIVYRCLPSTTNTSVANGVGGDFVMPFSGYISVVGATVDTAGTTNTTTIDVNKNGTSIMITKITIDSGEKTSRTAATPNVINQNYIAFSEGDIFTFDIDAISTTPAKGLSPFMKVVRTD